MEESRNDRPAVRRKEAAATSARQTPRGRKCNRSQELEIESNFLHLLALSLLSPRFHDPIILSPGPYDPGQVQPGCLSSTFSTPFSTRNRDDPPLAISSPNEKFEFRIRKPIRIIHIFFLPFRPNLASS